MSLFNPIKTQCERLVTALGDKKALGIKEAALSMRIKESEMEHSLALMQKRGYFGAFKPYIDEKTHLIIADKSYAAHAALVWNSERLMDAANEVRERTIREATSDEYGTASGRRAKAVGNFVRDVVEGAMNGVASQVLRDRSGGLVRDLINPGPRGLTPQDNIVIGIMDKTEAAVKDIREYALAHPEEKPESNDIAYLQEIRYMLDTCHSGTALQAACSRLVGEFIPALRTKLTAWTSMEDGMPEGSEDPLLSEIDRECDQLRALGKRVRDPRVLEGMTRINKLLNEICQQIATDPISRANSAVRSLSSCYLPVTKDLLEKYVQHEARGASDDATVAAMTKAADMLVNDLPTALSQLLKSIRASQVVDLRSQTDALQQKLRLDGLL